MIDQKQRLDKWLWFARVTRSRTLAQKLVASGAVRVDGERVASPDYRIVPGMVLTMNVHDRLRILKIRAPGTRRGPASKAATLFDDLSPEMPARDKKPRDLRPARRAAGAGRPTKRERRQTDRLRPHLPGEE